MKLKQTVQNQSLFIFTQINHLRDIRIVGQLAFVAVVLLVSWSGVKAIDTNYSLQKQVAALQQENEVQQLKNTNMDLQNTYYESDQYLELSAREDFGLGNAGEKELIVPTAVAMSYVVSQPSPPKANTAASLPFYERNLQAWIDFFLHRR